MGLLRQRSRQPEIMDQPDLDRGRHEQALAALSRINFLSATARSYLRPLIALQRDLGRPSLRILDVACGGGDVALRLRRAAATRGLDWRVAGCDLSPVAVEHARRQAARARVAVDYFVHDALSGPPPGEFDAAVCSLFLHHLDEDQAVHFLGFLARVEGLRMLLVSDLDRSPVGLALAHVVSRLLTTSSVVHTDGPRSVRAAFTRAEGLALAERAGLAGCQARGRWPWRWLLTWRRP